MGFAVVELECENLTAKVSQKILAFPTGNVNGPDIGAGA